MNLIKFQRNLYSQHGEDGIIEEIFRRLGIANGWFVEFGAWDGKYLSNTYNLLAHKDWRGVYIEADPVKYKDLLKTREAFAEKLHTMRAMVGFEGDRKLDNLLAQTPVPIRFDLLSIDIDSFDWQVWNALEKYRPKLVVIECNSAIPPGVVSIHNASTNQGSSFSAMVELGGRKGYQLICHTGNCFFLLKELVPGLNFDARLLASPEKLFNWRRFYKERTIGLIRKWTPGLLNTASRCLQRRKKFRRNT